MIGGGGGGNGAVLPFWKLWENPILRRYIRSRLRMRVFLPWLLIVAIVATFVFLLVWVGGRQTWSGDRVAVGRTLLFAMIPVQAFLMMLAGTGAVAAGLMLESSDGGIDYQRLTPLAPLTKIVGYLFGLPVREYCLFLITLPFTLFAALIGEVPPGVLVSLYAAFFTSVLLYHLIGCVAGMVVSGRFAARMAQVMVVTLYILLPQIAKLGFEFFSYLTILPVLSESIGTLVPTAQREFDQFFGTGRRSVSLFGMEIEALPFSLLIQGTLIVTFVVILLRKWRQPTHHMLGKNYAVGLCVWVHLLLLGSTIPLIDTGEIFPGDGRRARVEMEVFGGRGDGDGLRSRRGRPVLVSGRRTQDPRYGYWLAASYGVGALCLSCGLVLIITPTRDEFTKGLRRARKLGRRRVPWNADGAGALTHTVLLAAVGIAAWAIFAERMFGSEHFRGVRAGDHLLTFSVAQLRVVAASQLLLVVSFWAVLEWGQRRSLLLFVLFLWIVPVLAALVLLVAGAKFHGAAIAVAGVSALPSPFYALVVPTNYPRWYTATMETTFLCSVAFYAALVVFLLRGVRRSRREVVARVEADRPAAAPAANEPAARGSSPGAAAQIGTD